MKKGFNYCLAVLLLLGAHSLMAEDGPQEVDPLPSGGVYRYMGPSGDLVHTRTLPWDGIVAGYEVLDSRGRVVKSVRPLPTAEEKAERERVRAKVLAKAKKERRRRKLLGMYDTL